jgi:hypothetical protein
VRHLSSSVRKQKRGVFPNFGLDRFFDPGGEARDIVERPFVTVGYGLGLRPAP